jgi:hypothetical protein
VFSFRSLPIKYLGPIILILSFLDSILKEQPWVPSAARTIAFYLVGPLMALGMILLLPYMSERLEIVKPRRTSKFVLGIAAVISVIELVTWGVMYFQVLVVGQGAISTVALYLKYLVLVFTAGVFFLVGSRLLGWYGRIRNLVVLLFSFHVLGFAIYALMQIPNYTMRSIPQILLLGIGSDFLVYMWAGIIAVVILYRAYYVKIPKLYLVPVILYPLMVSTVLLSVMFSVTLEATLLSVLKIGFATAGLIYAWTYLRIVPALLNDTAKRYFRSVGYGIGFGAAATCGIGFVITPAFPLSGFPSLLLFLPAACLDFAAFTSSATYFSISEDIRREIRKSEVFISSIGDAESMMSTDRKVNDFYDRFKRLAKESGAVEESAFSKDEIYSLATAVRKTQGPEAKT